MSLVRMWSCVSFFIIHLLSSFLKFWVSINPWSYSSVYIYVYMYPHTHVFYIWFLKIRITHSDQKLIDDRTYSDERIMNMELYWNTNGNIKYIWRGEWDGEMNQKKKGVNCKGWKDQYTNILYFIDFGIPYLIENRKHIIKNTHIVHGPRAVA